MAADFQLLAWCGAFWAAWLGFARRDAEPGRRDAEPGRRTRFAAGLLLGAAACRGVGALLGPDAGYSLLGLPLGLLAASPRHGGGAWRAAAFGALPRALALARSGCLAAGCCGGAGHPVAAYEIAGWLALDPLTRRLSADRVLPALLVAFGGLRLLLQPLRDAGHGAGAWLRPEAAAAAWLGVGAALALREWRAEASRRRAPCTTRPRR